MLEQELAPPPADAMPRPPHVVTPLAVGSWVLYDLANTIFSMGVVSLYFSLWVRDQVGAERADSTYGLLTAVSMAITFVIAPLLGAMTDRTRKRMPFLVTSTIICVVFTALLARMGFWGTAICFIIANATYQAGLQFYDALLPEVSTEENRGKIGGIGVGIGYLGSYVAVGLGIALGTENKALLFTCIAAAFLLFSIPCFFLVRFGCHRAAVLPPLDSRMRSGTHLATICRRRPTSRFRSRDFNRRGGARAEAR